MAKEPKKTTAFGTSPDSFNESRRSRGNREEPTHKSVHNSTHNDVHIPTHNDVHNSGHKSAHNTKPVGISEPYAKEKKRKRVHLLTYESLIDRMDAYALRRGVKRVDVFETVMTAFLDQVEKDE